MARNQKRNVPTDPDAENAQAALEKLRSVGQSTIESERVLAQRITGLVSMLNEEREAYESEIISLKRFMLLK